MKTWSEFELRQLGVDLDGAKAKFNAEKDAIASRLPETLPDGSPIPDDHSARNVPVAKAQKFALEVVTPDVIQDIAQSLRESVFAFITSQ